jgi:tetratricopeptide (TPR) repeat protein
VRRRLVAVVVGLALAAAPAASAQTPDQLDRARTFFDAGAQAYANANYKDAARSFEQAYALAPRPQLLFSLAQAERKEGLSTSDASYLRRAVEHYKKYLEQVPTGGRRSEAIDAKADLEGRLARMSPNDAPATPAEKKKARVTVVSPTPGARVSLDNGPPETVPYFSDLDAGKHTIRVFAEGYFDEQIPVNGDVAGDQPLNVPLRDRPAQVTVALARAGELYVDGRVVATTPIASAIDVAPGPHVLSVAVNGKKVSSREVVLQRGKPFRFEPVLETSNQRIAAYGVLGGGVVTLVTGVVFAGLSLGQESRAKGILAKEQDPAQNITDERRDAYNRSIDQRDSYRTVSIVTLSAGVALAGAGVLLWTFDKPSVAVVPPRSEPGPTPQRTPSLELGAVPMVGPGVAGIAAGGRF